MFTFFAGIWDCLSTQQVAGCIRYLISQGKDLGEICETICDHCLAPDTIGGAGIGCDNMTILIIALLHGKTMEEWQAWVTERVKSRVGFYTPNELPRLYSDARLEGNRRRMAAWENRQQYWVDKDKAPEGQHNKEQGKGGITVVYQKTDQLFTNTEDSDSVDDDDSDTELPEASLDDDPTEGLRAQLHELDREEEERLAKKQSQGGDAEPRSDPPPPKDAPNGGAP